MKWLRTMPWDEVAVSMLLFLLRVGGGTFLVTYLTHDKKLAIVTLVILIVTAK
jgi:hypothetical protein